jgi:hypothetical protein
MGSISNFYFMEKEADPQISLVDRNKIQTALAKRAGVELLEWIEQNNRENSSIIVEIIKERPELVSGFADLTEDGHKAKKMLDDLEDELEKRKKK